MDHKIGCFYSFLLLPFRGEVEQHTKCALLPLPTSP